MSLELKQKIINKFKTQAPIAVNPFKSITIRLDPNQDMIGQSFKITTRSRVERYQSVKLAKEWNNIPPVMTETVE